MTASLTYSSSPYRVSVVVALLAGDDGRETALLEPAEQSPQLRAQNAFILEPEEERFGCVEQHPPGADLFHRVVETNEEAFEVVFAGFLDLGAIDDDVVDDHLAGVDERIQIESERRDILGEFLGVFLKAHQNAGLVVTHGAVDQKADPEERLPGAWTATHERRPPRRQSTEGDFVQTGDSGWRLTHVIPCPKGLAHTARIKARLLPAATYASERRSYSFRTASGHGHKGTSVGFPELPSVGGTVPTPLP